MRVQCTASGCKSRKPPHRMYEVKRSRADPTVLGHACSKECVAKVLAADPATAGRFFGDVVHAAAGTPAVSTGPLTRERYERGMAAALAKGTP